MPRPSRWFIVPALAILMAAPLHRAEAQLISISPGLMAGGSLSSFTGDTKADLKQVGFIAGAFVRVSVKGRTPSHCAPRKLWRGPTGLPF